MPTWSWYLTFPVPFWLAWFLLLAPGVAWWAARKDWWARARLTEVEREIGVLERELSRR